MKKFGDILIDLLKELAQENIDTQKLEDNPEFYIQSNWTKLAEQFEDAMLRQAVLESTIVSLEKMVLTIATKNANIRFLLNMSSPTIIAKLNRQLCTHFATTGQYVKAVKVSLPNY